MAVVVSAAREKGMRIRKWHQYRPIVDYGDHHRPKESSLDLDLESTKFLDICSNN